MIVIINNLKFASHSHFQTKVSYPTVGVSQENSKSLIDQVFLIKMAEKRRRSVFLHAYGPQLRLGP